MFVRYSSSILVASAVTLALFLLMQSLIADQQVELTPVKPIAFVDIFREPPPPPPHRRERTIERPQPPEAPPPDVQLPRSAENGQQIALNFPGPTTGIAPEYGPATAPEGDYLPLVRIQPDYPRNALERGIEGHVLVQLTVTPTGTVEEVHVLEASPPGYFERAAIRAAEKFKYKPKVVGGQAVAVENVHYLFRFTLSAEK